MSSEGTTYFRFTPVVFYLMVDVKITPNGKVGKRWDV
jgi:hypothetical protein